MAEKKIGKLEYRVERMPAFDTVKMGRRLVNVFGPALGSLTAAMSMQDSAKSEEQGLAALGVAAVAAMAPSLDDRFDATIKELVEMAQVKWNGQWTEVLVDQDELVQDASCLMQIAWFVLEVNFKSFFSELQAKASASQIPGSRKAG